jgi:hypothetical protein
MSFGFVVRVSAAKVGIRKRVRTIRTAVAPVCVIAF